MDPEIIVERSGIFRCENLDTKNQVALVSLESAVNAPFTIKRVYTISNFKDTREGRGAHAHHTTEQVIFCIHGAFTLALDDGERTQEIVLDNPMLGIKLGKMLWHSMHSFTPDCVIMVIADSIYDESDYIRDYDEFQSLVHTVE